ncbi:MAG TPA: response regulator, partial [Gemmatimonadales bacterium]|nr:response regulator [Gemmatimonadales bacterium]
LRSHERAQIREMVQLATRGVAGQLDRTLAERSSAALAVATRLLAEPSGPARERFAAAWLGATGGGMAIVTAGGPPRWLALLERERSPWLDRWWPDSTQIARAARERRVTASVVTSGDRLWLGLLAPDTSRAGRGMLWLVSDLSHAFDDILASVTGRFAVVVRGDGGTLLQRGALDSRVERLWGATAPVNFDVLKLEVAVWPTPVTLTAARSVLPIMTLWGGTAVGVLLGLSIALFRLARERTLEVQRANDRLTAEIREREAVQAELQQREEELRQAQKLEAVGRLAGGIAHDYNNILTVIRSNARGLLLREGVTDLFRDALEHMDRAAARGSLLTARLLAFSQRQLLQPETLSLGDLVASLRDELSHLLGPHVRLLVDRAPGVDLVQLDRRWMTQVVLDLALNAREAMPTGGTLWLRTKAADEALRAFYGVSQVQGAAIALEIEDSGRGMEPATRERLFEPFFSTKRFGQGSGLALASAYGNVRQSGGEITVRSEPGRGTRVAIVLPLVDGAPPETSDVNLAGLTVLVAEDEPGILRFVRRTLEQAGCRVIEGASAEAALDALARSGAEPDLLVSDIVMPGMSGVELAEALRRERPGLAVLFVSAYTSDALKQRGIEALAAFLLQKPFTAPELLEQVGRTLKASTARHVVPPA